MISQTSEFKSRFEANKVFKPKLEIEEDLQVHICVAFGGSSFRVINNLYRDEVTTTLLVRQIHTIYLRGHWSSSQSWAKGRVC